MGKPEDIQSTQSRICLKTKPKTQGCCIQNGLRAPNVLQKKSLTSEKDYYAEYKMDLVQQTCCRRRNSMDLGQDFSTMLVLVHSSHQGGLDGFLQSALLPTLKEAVLE